MRSLPVVCSSLHQVRADLQDVVGEGVDDVWAGDPRFEAERRGLNRRRDGGRADVGQDVGHLLRVARAARGSASPARTPAL